MDVSRVRAVVTQEFKGVIDGQIYPRVIEVGEEISGDLARVALEEKWAVPADDEAAGAENEPTDKPKSKRAKVVPKGEN